MGEQADPGLNTDDQLATGVNHTSGTDGTLGVVQSSVAGSQARSAPFAVSGEWAVGRERERRMDATPTVPCL